jgi:inner membrane protein
METKTIQHFFNSYSVKMVIISVMAVFLLIPSFLIQDIIRERIALSEKVKNELYSQWGGQQVVAGPVLNIPYSLTEPGEKNQAPYERHGVAHFLPESLKTDVTLNPEKRKRGIYEAVVYEGKISIKGTFTPPDVSRLDLPGARFNWNEAYFTIGVADMRGIKNMPELILNGQKYPVDPGVADPDLFTSGITVKAGSADFSRPLNFETVLVINGSEELLVEPLGRTTDVSMRSSWSEPSFTGGFLPVARSVSAHGFSATWRVTHLNRNYPQQWADGKYKTNESRMGVELLIPVDHYQKSTRSVKYAILFIALNFLVFIFIEIKSRIRIHPFQYSLVAFALLIFYVLLISIGEQTGFNIAYLVSAVAATLLISWYAFMILQKIKMAFWVMLLQTALYAFLFTILQLQDYALLAGSIGLFLILAIVMRASQQIKWYSEG